MEYKQRQQILEEIQDELTLRGEFKSKNDLLANAVLQAMTVKKSLSIILRVKLECLKAERKDEPY